MNKKPRNIADCHLTIWMTVREWSEVWNALMKCAEDDSFSAERRAAMLREARLISHEVHRLAQHLFRDIGEPGTPEYRQDGFTKA